MIKAVCFDLDGMYFPDHCFKDFRAKLAEFTSLEKAITVLHTSTEIMNFKKGLLTEGAFWEFARKELKLPYSNEEIFALLHDAYEVDPAVKELVGQVKALGIKACICSNNFVTRIRELDQKFQFLKDFDVSVISYEAHVLKPDPEIFKILIERCQLPAETIVYADDFLGNKLQDAIKLGINCFAFHGLSEFVSELRKLEVAV